MTWIYLYKCSRGASRISITSKMGASVTIVNSGTRLNHFHKEIQLRNCRSASLCITSKTTFKQNTCEEEKQRKEEAIINGSNHRRVIFKIVVLNILNTKGDVQPVTWLKDQTFQWYFSKTFCLIIKFKFNFLFCWKQLLSWYNAVSKNNISICYCHVPFILFV